MKFLTTATLALAFLAGTDATNKTKKEETMDYWEGEGDATVSDKRYMKNSKNGDWLIAQRMGGFQVLLPRRDEKDKEERQRKERALKINENRRHLAVEVEEVPTDGYHSTPLYFSFSGMEGVTVASLVLTLDGVDNALPLKSDIEADSFTTDGVAEVTLVPADGTYTWKLEHDDAVLQGGTITYGPPIITQRAGVTTVGESPYEGGGQVQGAVGRIYFESNGVDFACTGTAITDHKSGRSLVMTAAHCVFDDIDWNFGTNVIFIPDRDSVEVGVNVTAADIHRQCTEDICGCWSLSGGVVHDLWADTPWPDRLLYDYGFYVVDDVGAHSGTSCGSDALDQAVSELDFTIGTDIEGEFITGFGYSLEHNPDFRYCAEAAIVNQPTAGIDTAWLDNCGLTGGASGGPWLANFDEATGTGTVVSVNSWSYSDVPGMGGPFIDASAARCLVNAAREVDFDAMLAEDAGDEGIFVNCYDRLCVEDEETGRKLRGGRKLCEHKETL